ncbi:hypothetical protein BATDEDRAFT_2765, partial [Batrachochytrium dendrobatidis JAM81]
MSWKGFQKAVARIPHQLAKSSGHASETKDDEYEVYDASFKQLDTLARQLATEARKFKDSLSIMLTHQAGVACCFQEMFASFADEGSTKPDGGFSNDHALVTHEFQQEIAALRESLSSDLDMIERLVVAPTGDFITILDQVKKFMVKRSHKLIDYDRHRDATHKLREKADRSVSDEKRLGQYETSLDQATREYNAVNIQLKQDLPILLRFRVEFIDPCLLAFYSYQTKVYQALFSKLSEITQRHFDMHTNVLDGYNRQTEAVQELLSILIIPKRNHNTLPEVPDANAESAAPPSYSSTDAGTLPTVAANHPVKLGDSAASGSVNPPSLPRSVPPLPSSTTKYAIALYDFQAQADGDLSFSHDEKIEVVQRTADTNDWWIGRIGDRTGQFPGNYVR